MQDYWLKNDTSSLRHRDGKLFSNYVVPQHSKDGNSSRKCTASFIRRQNHNGEVVERISWSENESATGSMLLNSWGTTSKQMEHVDVTIAFSRRCNLITEEMTRS